MSGAVELWEIARSVITAIHLYRHNNGESPKLILAESDAYMALAADQVNARFQKDGGFEWQGIPVKMIINDGYRIYLAGDPIAITKFRENGGGEIVWPKN